MVLIEGAGRAVCIQLENFAARRGNDSRLSPLEPVCRDEIARYVTRYASVPFSILNLAPQLTLYPRMHTIVPRFRGIRGPVPNTGYPGIVAAAVGGGIPRNS
eukprot:1971849-Rhodomonas_salina.1